MGQGRKKNIPNRLRKYRRIAGYRQIEVAKILDHNSTSILSRWEKGEMLPGLKSVIKLSILYKTLVVELYFELLQVNRKEIEKLYKERKPDKDS